MTIEDAKINLEKQIIFWDGIIGIGILNEDANKIIEIAIDKNNDSITQRLNELIHESCWHGYNVKIALVDNFKLY